MSLKHCYISSHARAGIIFSENCLGEMYSFRALILTLVIVTQSLESNLCLSKRQALFQAFGIDSGTCH